VMVAMPTPRAVSRPSIETDATDDADELQTSDGEATGLPRSSSAVIWSVSSRRKESAGPISSIILMPRVTGVTGVSVALELHAATITATTELRTRGVKRGLGIPISRLLVSGSRRPPRTAVPLMRRSRRLFTDSDSLTPLSWGQISWTASTTEVAPLRKRAYCFPNKVVP